MDPISVYKPYIPSVKIIEQWLKRNTGKIARPDNVGMIGIRAVINPLFVRIMLRGIPHNNERVAGPGFQFCLQTRPVGKLRLQSDVKAMKRRKKSAPPEKHTAKTPGLP